LSPSSIAIVIVIVKVIAVITIVIATVIVTKLQTLATLPRWKPRESTLSLDGPSHTEDAVSVAG
jgi:hypothetical protein